MRIYMQTQAAEHQPIRFYHLHLEPDIFNGWLVTKEWGGQGSSGRVIKKHFEAIEDAEQEIIATRDKQINRGYRVVFAQGQTNPQ